MSSGERWRYEVSTRRGEVNVPVEVRWIPEAEL